MAPRQKVVRPQQYHTVSGVIIPQGRRSFLGEYVRDEVHINTLLSYFSQLKRSIDGTYHHVSEGTCTVTLMSLIFGTILAK